MLSALRSRVSIASFVCSASFVNISRSASAYMRCRCQQDVTNCIVVSDRQTHTFVSARFSITSAEAVALASIILACSTVTYIEHTTKLLQGCISFGRQNNILTFFPDYGFQIRPIVAIPSVQCWQQSLFVAFHFLLIECLLQHSVYPQQLLPICNRSQLSTVSSQTDKKTYLNRRSSAFHLLS